MKRALRRPGNAGKNLPRIDRWLMHGFEGYFLPGYLRKHFHALAVNRASLPPEFYDANSAIVVYANHASWWDPLVAIFLRNKLLPQHRLYAPIDAAALDRYRIFHRMGFYGIASNSQRGAIEFLQRSATIVQSPAASLWLTPEGKFCDVRDRDQPLLPGLAHLAATIEQTPASSPPSSQSVWIVPAAIEYTYWEERLPECLCWFGSPIQIHWGQATLDKPAWEQRLTQQLRQTQCELAAASIARNAAQFELCLSGQAGSWSVYDACRRFTARLRRQSLKLEHSEKLSSPTSPATRRTK